MIQEYRFRNAYRFAIPHLIIGAIFLVISIFILVRIVFTDQLTVFSFIAFAAMLFVALINIQPARGRFQYQFYDKDKIVHLNKSDKTILVKSVTSAKEIQLNTDNVKEVELYFSWNTMPITSDLGYSKIKLSDEQTVVLTQMTIDQSIIKSLFHDKVIKEKTRFMKIIR